MRLVYLPFISFFRKHVLNYGTPANLTYLWSFGFLAGCCLVIQLLTGILLSMHYNPSIAGAFDSIQHIHRNVPMGWFLKYTHANTASMFFIVIYIHMGKAIYFKSYLYPRQFLWLSGVVIFILLMATAFIGYVLPWGQMSYWGATVITNLVTAVPYMGQEIAYWLWGGFSINNATLNRFFSLHYLMPFIILGLVIIHLGLLHVVGNTNPLGFDHDFKIPFYPYFLIKDLLALNWMLLALTYLVFFNPNYLGHPANFIPANSLVTPKHIVPEWYFLPFYAILRSIPDKLGGVLAMFGAIVVIMLLPFIDPIKITMQSDFNKVFFWIFIANFALLKWIGEMPMEYPFLTVGAYLTVYHFAHFLVIVPSLGLIDIWVHTQNKEEYVKSLINN